MRRIVALACLLALAPASSASADALLPPKGKTYSGVTGSQ